MVHKFCHAKDWQNLDEPLKAMEEVFASSEHNSRTQFAPKSLLLEDLFIQNCMVLLKNGLESNVMQIYLKALDSASVFLQKTIKLEAVNGSLSSLI